VNDEDQDENDMHKNIYTITSISSIQDQHVSDRQGCDKGVKPQDWMPQDADSDESIRPLAALLIRFRTSSHESYECNKNRTTSS
jgi:hypothetical protein